jgi:hypothetical protein
MSFTAPLSMKQVVFEMLCFYVIPFSLAPERLERFDNNILQLRAYVWNEMHMYACMYACYLEWQ